MAACGSLSGGGGYIISPGFWAFLLTFIIQVLTKQANRLHIQSIIREWTVNKIKIITMSVKNHYNNYMEQKRIGYISTIMT